ncbi:MAG TPA: alpha/beta hydrolase-fold protein, partial [Cellvibrionaceae bacterium]|nr:alpha/beta hydrolase-fold protein [Cellvibrionaceae bacterium]
MPSQQFRLARQIRRLLGFIFLVLLSGSFLAEAAPYQFANTSVQTLKAATGDLSHQLIITLPDSYATEKTKRYPVVYYLDAYWDFPLLYATYGNLRYDRAIPEVILVGLSIAGEGYNAYRSRYFSIFSDPHKKFLTGQANLLYRHLTQDIIPSIDAQLRTQANPAGRILAGQSMGGLFTLFGLLQPSAAFGRFIAVNPAVAGSEAELARL